jgi:hypothetical protein
MAEANVREPATESQVNSLSIRGIDDDATGGARSTGVGLVLGGTEVTSTAAELNIMDGVTATTAEINILDGVTALAGEINAAADVSVRVQELTVSGAVTARRQSVELNHATVAVAATIADSTSHEGVFHVKNTSASGTAAHTLTLTAGTFNGTNNVATLNAPDEALIVYFDSAGNGSILANIGSVALSGP